MRLESGFLTESVTWPRIAGGYSMGDLLVLSAAEVQLRFEPGAILRFDAGGGLTLGVAGSRASVVAKGAQGEKVSFVGGEPAPGFWGGLLFGFDTLESLIEHVEVLHGGTRGANIILQGTGDRVVIRDSIVGLSSGAGILATDCQVQPDLSGVSFYGNSEGDYVRPRCP